VIIACVCAAKDGDERSLLLVHAHPDDESIGTGATMARYAAEGARVTLVTCTLGELGEIIPPSLRHMNPDELAAYRVGELANACDALGVTDHRFLGGRGRWRDSGMMGLPDNDDPRCFWQADVDEAALDLVRVIHEVRPQVIVTYDANGFYGHPDHIQAHRVTRRAFRLAGDPAVPGRPWQASKLYATAMPRSVLAEAVVLPEHSGFEQVRDLRYSVPDDQVKTAIDGNLDAKLAAMRAHATQIAVDGEFYALSNHLGQRVLSTEYYTLLAGTRGPGTRRGAGKPYERDLFAPSPAHCVAS
jgi:N-acetyl-1-D-myo-inositol-2-amino-2-deoxy-alpha-D-glucopyranoside deacetylase